MEITFVYVLRASKILTEESYTITDLLDIYNFSVTIDNNQLNGYFKSKTIYSYQNDLLLFIDVLKKLILIFEEKEEYEMCHELKLKLIECEEIITKNKNKTYEELT